MSITELSESQIKDYFASVFGGLKDKTEQMAKCLWHEDATASLALNLSKGTWICHAGCGSGGLIDLESRLSGCDRQTAYKNIMQKLSIATPEKTHPATTQEPEAIYQYRDAIGKDIFQKLRYPGKKFFIRRQDENGHWIFKAPVGLKPLYNLKNLITSDTVIVAEGEKDCDNVTKANLAQFIGNCRIAAVTNFDGAGKWDSSYNPYFTGKLVFILPDNDAVGKAHARLVAESVYDFAYDVHIVDLPGLPEHGDVSDFLASNSPQDLFREIAKTLPWRPQKSSLILRAPDFLSKSSPDIVWLVNGILQRGSNGFIAASPKIGKSWLALDLAVAMATGSDWLGIATCKANVALISREDNPALTRWRLDRLLRGRGLDMAAVGNLWINSKDQSPEFRLDNPRQLEEMIKALKGVKPELILLDVMNVLHGADENDNTAMRNVMDCADILHKELSSSVGILHHFNKMETGRITERLRGASGIAGWAEWVMGIRYASDADDEKTRLVQFDIKAGEQKDPIFFEIKSENESGSSRIEVVNFEKPGGKRNKAESVISCAENLNLGI